MISKSYLDRCDPKTRIIQLNIIPPIDQRAKDLLPSRSMRYIPSTNHANSEIYF